MEYSAYEEATVPICSFILKNSKGNEKSLCFRLSDFKGGMEVQKQKVIEAIENKDCGYFYEADEDNCSKIPGSPIAYWLSRKSIENFETGSTLNVLAEIRQGLATSDNNRYLRLWYEVQYEGIDFEAKSTSDAKVRGYKWFPFNKGGNFRKWYGNLEYIVDYYDDGADMKANVLRKYPYLNTPDFVVKNTRFYFLPSITWTEISSTYFSVRYCPPCTIFSNKSNSIFANSKEEMMYLLALLCSKPADMCIKAINPTITTNVGDVAKIPVLTDRSYYNVCREAVENNIELSKNDWDSFETSWDFRKHPLIRTASSVAEVFGQWENECENRFNQLKANEEELNRIFIDIYGLQDELTPDVEDKDVTLKTNTAYRYKQKKKNKKSDNNEYESEEIIEPMEVRKKRFLHDTICELISYAVGCMFGRYSLDVEGLAYAGGQWDDSKYTTFVPDADNCIPITDEEYFEDDIVGLFCDWLKKVYGEDTLEENLDFIAKALGNKGSTSREIIRNYFLNDFIKDHIKIYQKRPIYWLFDSGKQNGFKALCYMHRWNADTIGHMRVEYLHRMQRVYDKEIERMQEIIDNSRDNKEINKATKRKEKLQKQVKETKDYDAMVAHLALSRIDIDLDDGVKINYEKVQTADGKKMQILAKI